MDKKTIIIIAVVVVVLLIALGIFFSGSLLKSTSQKYEVDLEVWGLFDDSDVFSEIFENFKKIDPNIRQINYKKLTTDTYKTDLIEAIASGKGPDIFIIHNTWLPSFQDKLAPAPTTILNEQVFKKNFVDVASRDFISEGKVYAVPLTVDSLALFYNKDFFNNAGIALPPTDWDKFTEDVKIFTKKDSSGGIYQSGAALGTARNINRVTDVLGMLMFQYGSNMNSGDQAAFSDEGGNKALSFFTEFSRASNPLYSWNSRMHNSVDAFSEGKLAMMFNYSWQLDVIKKKSPKLNFAVAPVPQVLNQPRVDYANYWGYGVARNKTIATSATASGANVAPVTNDIRVAEAWKLLKFIAAKADAVTEYVVDGKQTLDPKFDAAINYLEKTKKPTARRDLIDAQKTDPVLGVFAEQNLFAKSWIQKNPDAVEGVMMNMIDNVNSGEQTISEALHNAEVQINRASGIK